MEPFIVAGLVWIAVLVGLFLLGRAITLWYFKIDDGIALLQEIRDELRAQRKATSPRAVNGSTTPQPQPLPSPSRSPSIWQLAAESSPVLAPVDVQLYDAPSLTARYLFSLPRSTSYVVVQDRGEWSFVRSASGTEG
jgi:hypothetical protein